MHKRSALKIGTIAFLSLLVAVQLGSRVWDHFSDPAVTRAVIPATLGQTVPGVEIHRLFAGSQVSHDTSLGSLLTSQCSILYFFNPFCSACKKGAPAWRGVRSISRAKHTASVIWVTMTDDTAATYDFLREFGIVAPVIRVNDSHPYHVLNVPATPMVWGVTDGVIRYIDRGYRETAPVEIDLGWCDRNT